MQMSSLWRPVMGILVIAVGLLLFPIIITGAEAVRTDSAVGNYSGLSNFIVIVPVLAMVALIASGGFLTWTGVKSYRKKRASRRSKAY